MLTFFTPFDVKMIQISTFPAAPSTERVPSLAERVASLRYSINLQLLNNRVPGLVTRVVAIVLIVTMMIMKMVIMMIRPIAGLEWLRKYSNHKLVHSDIMLERENLE